MPRVLLAGAFGQGNPGDEALLRSFVSELDGFDAVATSTDPLATAALYGIEAVPSRDARAVARAARAADGVVFAGGTVFKTLDPRCGRRPLALLASASALAGGARAMGRPLALVGVGVGALPGRPARVLARGLVRAADLLVLRDEESAAALAAARAPAPLRVGADPSWSLVSPPAAAGAGGETIVVALSRFAGGADLGERLAGALRPALAAGLRVRLQPWGCTRDALDDRALASEVAERLGRVAPVAAPVLAPDGAGRLRGAPGVFAPAALKRRGPVSARPAAVEIVAPPADLCDAAELFAGARLVVALRFHALPAAAAAGVPVLALGHERKLSGLARRLRQPAVAAGAPPERIAQAIMGALDHPPAPAEAIAAEVAAANEQMRLLRLLLRRGEAVHAEHDLTGLSLHPEEWVERAPALRRTPGGEA